MHYLSGVDNGKFDNWIVTVKEIVQAQDGSAAVMFQMPCGGAMLGSDACQKNANLYTIQIGTSAFREAQLLSRGDFVVTSGRFPLPNRNSLICPCRFTGFINRVPIARRLRVQKSKTYS